MNKIFLDSHGRLFDSNQNINLRFLKKDIDKRFDKIRSLIGLSQINFNELTNKQFTNTACQTSCEQIEANRQNGRHRRTLSYQQGNSQREVHDEYNKRSSLVSKKNQTKLQKNQEEKDCDVRIKIADYLSSQKKHMMKKTYQHEEECFDNENEDEIEKNNFINSQDDKIFQSIEFQLHSSFKSAKSFTQRQVPLCTYIISESVSGEPSSAQTKSMSSDEPRERSSFWGINQQQSSMKKMKYTDRTCTSQVKRLIVSEDCRSKIAQTIKIQVNKNRKEPTDSKLRFNLIKKIEEKYGEYYENN